MQDLFKNYLKKYMAVVGTLGQLIYYFQAYQIWSTQSCDGVSFLGFLIASISTTSWALYGLVFKDKTLASTQAFGVIGCIWCLIMIKTYS